MSEEEVFKVELTEKQALEILKETLKKFEVRGSFMYLLRKS